MLYVLHALDFARFADPIVRVGVHELPELDLAANTIATTVSAIASGKNKMAGCRRMIRMCSRDGSALRKRRIRIRATSAVCRNCSTLGISSPRFSRANMA
jgi:hypothetical protein